MSTHYGLFGSLPTTSDPGEIASLGGYARGLSKSRAPGSPELWAVGRASLPDGEHDVPITWSEIERDVAWAARMLDELGVKPGDFCLYSFLYAQSAQFWAFLKASFDRGARVATGSAWSWDAYRHEMYLRLFDVALAFGASGATVQALQAMGHDPARVFAPARTLVVLPDAVDALKAGGLKPWKLVWLGPVFALDPDDGSGARFDSNQWALEAVEGEIAITGRDRTTAFDRVRTGVAGRVESADGEPRLFTA